MVHRLTRKELKNTKASNFDEGDIIQIGKYYIHIQYGQYKIPLRTWVERENGKILGCTPGTKNGWPYFIADFIH